MVPDYTASKDVMERAFTENLANLGRVLEFPLHPSGKQALTAGTFV
jgi:hypothetical protein